MDEFARVYNAASVAAAAVDLVVADSGGVQGAGGDLIGDQAAVSASGSVHSATCFR